MTWIKNRLDDEVTIQYDLDQLEACFVDMKSSIQP